MASRYKFVSDIVAESRLPDTRIYRVTKSYCRVCARGVVIVVLRRRRDDQYFAPEMVIVVLRRRRGGD